MSYALVDVELTKPPPAVQLGHDETGLAIVSRRHGQVVGFAMHEVHPGTRLHSDDVEALLDPFPVEPPLPDPSPDPVATITVAVCTRDRTELLGDCLAALLRLDPPPDEILVVDNAPSDERTRDLAAHLGVGYEVEPCPGLDFARNCALHAARSDVVAFVDDDVVVDNYWLQNLRAVWRQHPDAGLITGQVLPWELATDAQIAFERRGGFRGGNAQIRYAGHHLEGDPIYPYGAGIFGTGANMALRRIPALRLGGFDEALDTGPALPGGGDLDMMHRVIRGGLPLVYEPRAVVFHRHRRDVEGLRRQYRSWGRSLMAYVVKTYRLDREGRPKLRRLVRWFFLKHLREARQAGVHGDSRDAARAELRGGLTGLLGTYGRSRRQTRRVRRTHGKPTVALVAAREGLHGLVDRMGLTGDDFDQRMAGGWTFAFAEALRRAGVDTVMVCWSADVIRPTRRIHAATGAALWFLPPSRPLALAHVLRRENCRAILHQRDDVGRFDLCAALGRLLRVPVHSTSHFDPSMVPVVTGEARR